MTNPPTSSSNTTTSTSPTNTNTSTSNPSNRSKIILLTGINGYISSHIALQLLQKGYTVRGTSRHPSSTTIPNLLSNPAFHSDQIDQSLLQHVTIPDITAPNVFDDAVRDIHAVIHTASPVDFSLKSVDEFFAPAVGGVMSVLKSVYNENLRRQSQPSGQNGDNSNNKIVSFVLTSSIAAVVDRWRYPPISMGGTENRAYTEADWNTSGEKVARQSEVDGQFLPMVAYGASKAAAEQAMWKFIEERGKENEQHAKAAPACSAICPGVTTGPPVNWPSTPSKLNETLYPVWSIWSGEAKKLNKLPAQIGGASHIDVRDVAAMHVWCMEHPRQSGGERYLMTNGKAPPQGTADVLRDVLFKDDEKVRERIIVGEPGKGWCEGFGWPVDEPTVRGDKARLAMGGQEFRGFEENIRDTVLAFRERWPEFGY